MYSLSEGNIPLQILNTRYSGRCSALQYQQYTLQCTAFLLATLRLDRTKYALPPQASKHALILNCPVTRVKVYTSLLYAAPWDDAYNTTNWPIGDRTAGAQ